LENATRICRAEFGRMALSDGSTFKTAAMFGGTPEYARFLEENPEGHGGLISQMTAERKAIHVLDAREAADYRSGSPFAVAAIELAGARSAIVVPLLKEGALIGALVLYRTRVEAFTESQIALVQTFADQAVIAIENARLINETREALERQTATAEVRQVINAPPGDLAPVFDAMLEKATALCEAKFGLLWFYDGSAFILAATRNIPPALASAYGTEPRQMGPNTTLARAVRTKQLVHIADLKDDVAYLERDPARIAVVELGGARAHLVGPLLKKSERNGVIAIYLQAPGAV